MNYIPSVAQMLGVEVNEEFKVKNGSGAVYGYMFRFTETDLQGQDIYGKWYPSALLNDLIQGKCEIVKLPFKPEDGQNYWFVVWGEEEGLTTDERAFLGSEGNYADVFCGNCFRTETEAENNKLAIYKKLTGHDWVEPEEADE